MDNSLIIILGVILLFFIFLNHITVIKAIDITANCSQTKFGCCPDGVNSKIDYFGSNCPKYNPGPGYFPIPTPLPSPPPGPGPAPPKPIGGCAGTRYGCCPNQQTAKVNENGSNCILK